MRLPLRLRAGFLRVGEIVCGCRAFDLAGLPVGAEIAAVASRPERREFDDCVHFLKQFAVVTDDDRAALPVADVPDHRGAALIVEIVGGFVEEQEIGLREDQRGKCGATALTARERGKGSPGSNPEPRSRERGFDPCRQRPVGSFEFLDAGAPRFGLVEAFERGAAAEKIGDGLVAVVHRVLPHHGDAAGYFDMPARRLQLAGNQLEKRRLADTVAPDEAGAFGGKGECQIGDDGGGVRRRPGQIVKGNKCRHGTGNLAT